MTASEQTAAGDLPFQVDARRIVDGSIRVYCIEFAGEVIESRGVRRSCPAVHARGAAFDVIALCASASLTTAVVLEGSSSRAKPPSP